MQSSSRLANAQSRPQRTPDVDTDEIARARGKGGWRFCRGPCRHDEENMKDGEPHKRCLSGLWASDPRMKKRDLDEGPSIPSSRWILESRDFQDFLSDDSARLLWIQTEMSDDSLDCVIDEVPNLIDPGTPVAYCFCPQAVSEDDRKGPPPMGDGFEESLSGLIYLLVESRPFLVPWVWKDSPDSYTVRSQVKILERVHILERMLAHPNLGTVFLVIGDLGAPKSIEHRHFLEFMMKSARSGRAKWIISSRFSPRLRENRFRRLQWELVPNLGKKEDPVLASLKWLRLMNKRGGVDVLDSAPTSLEPPTEKVHPSDFEAPRSPCSGSEMGSKAQDLETSKPIYEELVPYDEFRTVTLWGGNDTGDIKCTIQRECIHHPPPFEALSYEWRPLGNSEEEVMRYITVNDKAFPVGQNLWDALRHLRPRPGGKRRLWIDAICIWQSSDRDRNMQVVIMPIIYSSATTVISWVGMTMPEVVKASMSFLSSLPGIGAANMNESGVTHLPPSVSANKRAKSAATRINYHGPEWLDIRAFFSLRYWKRLWVAQEVVLSHRLQIQCEEVSVDSATLSSFLEFLRDSDNDLPKRIRDLLRTPAGAILSYRHDVQSLPRRDFPLLRETLATFAGSRCSDPRDHVYGLLGITSRDTTVQPDYSKSALGLYVDMMSERRLRTDAQLMSFSQLLQRVMGGLFHPSNPMSNVSSNTDEELHKPGTFYTRARICGNISLVGDTYTTAEAGSKLLEDWHALYFHHVRTHRPGDELPLPVKQALLDIHKDVKKAVSINSRLSYAYVGIGPKSQKPSWDQIRLRYDDDTAAETETCPGHATPGSLCPCLRTERLDTAPRWIIGTRGQVGLVAGAAQEGDTICHFENSDVAVIVRRFADGFFHSIVGRGLIFRKWNEEPCCGGVEGAFEGAL
ncbi:heterokaryon incompatibility protein-domain-containing protein [Podospora aff. communis PSN243]|uniref:Heterokaryon incompatibility protein-domain-containing protein n=1 Tax=Podospora aff. communis PSN243 TaxID=3040156 RepID=A0AAV9GL59_9PEZI|nr:heterokaryon incompatibility protein-domain-containing protein [Podospora aff. communis PSN243]